MRENGKIGKGFTLVELLVVIVILGIIVGLSIPLIRNIKASNKNRKFETYERTLIDSAKLYTDSYSTDMFGNSNYGCVEIPYSDLSKKSLIKDIQSSDFSCNDTNTYVRVIKLNDKYTYETKLTCKDKKSAKNVFTSNKIQSSTIDCNGGAISKGPTIEFNPEKEPNVKVENKSKDKSVNIVVKSDYGIKEGSLFYYAWSLKEDGSDISQTEWKPKKITGSTAELEKIHYVNKSISVTTKGKATGDYYLFVRTVDNNGIPSLVDAAGNASTTEKYHAGIYVVDKTAPVITNIGVKSEQAWNSKNIRVNLNDSKDEVNGTDLRVCLKQGNEKCGDGEYVKPDKAKLTLTGVTYNGAEIEIKVDVRDLAGNETEKTVKYNLYQECQTANLVKTTLKLTGTCSRKCEGGTRTDVYNTKDKNSGNNCSGKTIDVANIACNTMKCCSSLKTSYSDWVDNGKCSAACDGGTKQQKRTVTKTSTYTGQECSKTTETRSVACNSQDCCSVVSTIYGSWTDVGSCSKKCGPGTIQQTRTVTKISSYTGKTCSATTEKQSVSCNLGDCCSSTEVKCGNYGGWTSCSAKCNGGTKTRSRTCANYSKIDGSYCSANTSASYTTERASCNNDPCAPTITCKKSGANGIFTTTNGVKSHWQYWKLVDWNKSGTGNFKSANPYQNGYGKIKQNSTAKWTWDRSTFAKMDGRSMGSDGDLSSICKVR